jgi:hypothetical protein
MKRTARILVLIVCAVCANTVAQTVTLVPPVDPDTKKYDDGRSCFNFRLGLLKETVVKQTKKNDWDLGYGFLAIAEQDWFVLNRSAENRSVIKDLGERSWDNPGTIPTLEPLPILPKGERRQITVDSSGDTHRTWAKTTNLFAKVLVGHMYVLHIKNENDDSYVLFRVEELEQGKRCTISWRRIPSPEEQEAPKSQ